jgi:hypothetical protein
VTGGRICCVCDQPISGEANVIVRHSVSGARPDDYCHKVGDVQCIPRRNVPTMVARHLARRP